MKITGRAKHKIAQEMFGLFFEDINFAADGGLHAEMIENRSFEAKEAFGIPGKFYTVDDNGYAWSAAFNEGDKEPRLQIVQGTPLSEVNPHYLRLTTYKAMQGFKNKAYDGITLKKGMSYKLSFYSRCVRFNGDGIVASVTKDGREYGSVKVSLKKAAPYAPYCDVVPSFVSGWKEVDEIAEYRKTLDLKALAKESEWVKHEAEIVALDDVRGADFTICLDSEGVVEFDLISLIPCDAVAGVFRKDLFEALDSIHPGFIRFPGGCIVEGISLENRYRWKNTVGPLKDRKYIPNLWAFDDSRSETDFDHQRPDAHYGQSYGIGFYEYFLLCELLKAKPLPVLGIAVACQFRTDELIELDDEKFNDYVQDAVDLIEFANGDVTTKWGALRASMGHPAPFNLELLSTGNEQWETENVHLFERLKRFEKAIRAKYPDIKLIGTAGPYIDQPMAKTAWNYYREAKKNNESSCYAVDEHYYVSPAWMYERIALYDEYPRDVAVFAGEYAAHPTGRENTMEGALAEAAFLTGLERNADVVKLASYAPLFNRTGHSQWKPDMIWFDDKDVFLSPNYYVQKLYANNVGDFTIDMEGEEKALWNEKIYVSVTGKEDGTIILKAANCSGTEYKLPLTDEAGKAVSGNAEIFVLKGDGPEKENMPQPSVIAKCQGNISGSVTLAPKTFTVVRLMPIH